MLAFILLAHPEDAPGESDTMSGAEFWHGVAIILIVVLAVLAIVGLVRLVRGK